MFKEIVIPVVIFVGLGLLSGVLLTVFSKKFDVKTDDRVKKIVEALPGLNCGVCGYSGCENYANELVNNDAPTNKCVPGGDNTSKEISVILGKTYEDVIEKIAYVSCNGKSPIATNDGYVYEGEKTCAACNLYYNGKGECDYGCIGYGDCVKKCNYGAISIIDEIAYINPSLCKGCNMCVSACPKNLIKIRTAIKKVYVQCSSCDNGKITNQKCSNGCIACKKCEKVCPSDAIKVENNIAKIDYDKCIDCLECAKNCPKHCIAII